MARKEPKQAAHPRGFSDIIGIVLIAIGLLLLVAQLSFDRLDVAANRYPPNVTPHNWIGKVGAFGANGLFFLFGAGAFVLPILLLVFGLGYLFEFFAYLKRRWIWAAVLFLACLGFFDTYSHYWENLRQNLNAPSAGGLIGKTMNDLLFGHFGTPGATIIFATLYVISLIFLTNFKLGEWLRSFFSRQPKDVDDSDWTPEEKALARRARELERQARKLQEHVDKSGLGADLKPVPAPTVRDLSVPPTRPAKAAKVKAPEPEIEKPGIEGEVISAKEIAAATTADVLGKSPECEITSADSKAADPLDSTGEKQEPVTAVTSAQSVNITDNTGARTKRQPKKPKPIAVAATPLIGNYQLPPLDFLQFPDLAFRPTESKEELMANARLMQSTLAQFDIEVALGVITKGPTITRYELHPAPGVKLEKISGLNNNIAAALKAERIHILAPVPGKSSVGVEVPNVVKTKVIIRDLLESEEWQKTKARIPLALGKDVYGHPIIADLSDMPHLLIAGSTGSGKSVCINSIIASLLYKFRPDQLRFVMIDPKVVELQHYNTLPHLVVPVVTDPKKVILALRWVVNEMEKRYQIFAKVGVRNIKSFNERPKGRHAAPPAQAELPL